MKYQIKHQDNNDLVHAVLRMTAKEYQALRNYMHCEKKEHIVFPYGAYITVRTRGWYRVIPNNDTRAIEKIQFAVVCIRRFLADEESRTEEELKMLMPSVLTNTKLAAFSNYHSTRDLTYLGDREPPKPASQTALQKLAQKFSR